METAILDHIPVPLAQQVVDNKMHIADMKISVANSSVDLLKFPQKVFLLTVAAARRESKTPASR